VSDQQALPSLDTWDAFVDRLYAQGEFDIDFGLEEFEEALRRWDAPHRSHPVVLVGGTNGKGGVASRIDAILGAHGLKTGLFTSPHILSIRERFRVDGQPANRQQLLRIGRRAIETFGNPDGDAPQLSFFELCCLMATTLFRDEQVDVGIYEVGLGGRLDATNSLDPAVSVLTRIGLDHQKFLGETLEEIVGEKVGILRSERPAVVGIQDDDHTSRLIRESAPVEADIHWIEEKDVSSDTKQKRPRVQRENAAAALTASEVLLEEIDESFVESAAERGLGGHVWPGRFDRRRVHPDDINQLATGDSDWTPSGPTDLLIDSAHNPQAVDWLVRELQAKSIPVHAALVGFMSDKDAETIVRQLVDALDVSDALFGAEIASERAMGAEQLEALGCSWTAPASKSLSRAIRTAHRQSDGADVPVVLVTGSVYLVGEVFDRLGVQPADLKTRQTGEATPVD